MIPSEIHSHGGVRVEGAVEIVERNYVADATPAQPSRSRRRANAPKSSVRYGERILQPAGILRFSDSSLSLSDSLVGKS
ncbi:MAG: hypothetical protein ACI8UO_001444 [Verrucomicrobiales bacterium]|jgi:hypothetical protein